MNLVSRIVFVSLKCAKKQPWIILLLLVNSCIIIYYINLNSKIVKYNSLHEIINLPSIIDSSESFDNTYKNLDASQKNAVLTSTGKLLVKKIQDLQFNGAKCSSRVFLCGHTSDCGFGCQIHHRALCLALSQYFQIPLIHTSDQHWPFIKPWDEAFLKFGSNCSLDRPVEVYKLIWYPFSVQRGLSIHGIPQFFIGASQYPFQQGLIVPQSLGNIVNQLHQNPLLWWMGQFVKYTMRLTPEQNSKLLEAKQSLGLKPTNSSRYHNLIGIHIRQTDKFEETPDLSTKIEDYFDDVWKLIRRQNIDSRKLKVFVASDDHEMLIKARERYQNITILNFLTMETHKNQGERKSDLDSIIRDIMILSQCEYVICNLDSNFCRVVAELIAADDPNGEQRIISPPQYKYHYKALGVPRLRDKILYYDDQSIN